MSDQLMFYLAVYSTVKSSPDISITEFSSLLSIPKQSFLQKDLSLLKNHLFDLVVKFY